MKDSFWLERLPLVGEDCFVKNGSHGLSIAKRHAFPTDANSIVSTVAYVNASRLTVGQTIERNILMCRLGVKTDARQTHLDMFMERKSLLCISLLCISINIWAGDLTDTFRKYLTINILLPSAIVDEFDMGIRL